MWNVNVTIKNNTDYTITTVNNYSPQEVIQPNGGEFSWNTTEPNNSTSIRFWKIPSQWYMQGGVSFGPEAGVYVDRGWMSENDQTISMTAVANGKTWTQISNGGETLLVWNEFEQGGDITLTFNTYNGIN
jgi:hypothetical protein